MKQVLELINYIVPILTVPTPTNNLNLEKSTNKRQNTRRERIQLLRSQEMMTLAGSAFKDQSSGTTSGL
mgnify:CR=1 FL=1